MHRVRRSPNRDVHFWEELYEQRNVIVAASMQRPYVNALLVTDRGIGSFGESRSNERGGLVWIRCEVRPRETLLERLTLRGYPSITDQTLRHLAEAAPHLRHLDVYGTGCTAAGVRTFRLTRPGCELVTSFDDDDDDDDEEDEGEAAAEPHEAVAAPVADEQVERNDAADHNDAKQPEANGPHAAD